MSDSSQNVTLGKKTEVSIRVFRAATGKWENFGVVSSYKLTWKICNFFKKLYKKFVGGV